jgi:predicted MFS family arabinose efflux permease
VAGGYLTQHFGWRSVFLVNLPVGLLAALMVVRLPARQPPERPWTFDTWGLVLLIACIGPVLLALDQAQHMSAGRLPAFLALMGVGIAALLMLIRRERRVPFPLLPVQLFRNPTIWRSDALAACHGATLVSLVTFLPIYLHVGQSTSSAQAGLLLLPFMFGIGSGSMLTGRIVSRTGLTVIFPSIGLVFATLTLVALALWAAELSRPQWAWLLFANGLFMGTVMGVVQVTVQSTAGPGLLGAAAASVQLSRSLGAATGTALVGTVLFAALSLSDPNAGQLFGDLIERNADILASMPPARQAVVRAEIDAAFRAAFLTIAGFALIGLAFAWSIPKRRL